MGVFVERPTVWVSNIPQSIIAEDLLQYLESRLGQDSVFAIEIQTERKNWKSRGVGRVQFTSLDFKTKALNLSLDQALVFKSHCLEISETYADIIARPIKDRFRVEDSILHVGFMRKEERLCVLESWEGVRGWLMPERSMVEFWIWQKDEQECDECCYKLEISFEDILETVGCRLDGEVNGILLQACYSFFFLMCMLMFSMHLMCIFGECERKKLQMRFRFFFFFEEFLLIRWFNFLALNQTPSTVIHLEDV